MKKIVSFCFLFYFNLCQASPWFTGPLLAPGGKTIANGHANFEFYSFDTKRNRYFDKNGRTHQIPRFESLQFNPVLTYGLSDWLDAQWSIPYSVNHSQRHQAQHIGDTSILLGIQTYKQKTNAWLPSLRVTIQEIFPTGRYDGFNPIDKGTGVSGSGTYQTIFSLDFQHLKNLYDLHYLRTRLSISYLYSSSYSINDRTKIPRATDPKGHVKPGNLQSADLAAEYTLTQNWVAVMEGYIFYHEGSSLQGQAGINENGSVINVSSESLYELTLAPAIEYNFTENIGIIGGYWWAVKGKNVAQFQSIVVALNIYW